MGAADVDAVPEGRGPAAAAAAPERRAEMDGDGAGGSVPWLEPLRAHLKFIYFLNAFVFFFMTLCIVFLSIHRTFFFDFMNNTITTLYKACFDISLFSYINHMSYE